MQGNPVNASAVNTATQAVTTTTELAVATLTISPGRPGQTVDLDGIVTLTTGTGTTGVTVRIRRGSGITGTVVQSSGVLAIVGAVGAVSDYGVQGTDTPGDVVGQQYTITIQQAAATANGSVTLATIQAVAHG